MDPSGTERQSPRTQSMKVFPGASWVRSMSILAPLCVLMGGQRVQSERQGPLRCVRCTSELVSCWTN